MSTVYVVGSGSDISKSRQSRVKLLEEGDLVRIVREPNNKHDRFAIRVTTVKTAESPSKTIGYVPKQFSHLLTAVLIDLKKKALKVNVTKVVVDNIGDTKISIKVPKFW